MLFLNRVKMDTSFRTLLTTFDQYPGWEFCTTPGGEIHPMSYTRE